MKNKLKIIVWVFVAIIFLVIYWVFIKKDNNLEVYRKVNLNPNEEIAKNYNSIISNIDSKSKIDDCDKIEQKNLAGMCKDFIKSKFSEEKKFTNLDQCNKIYTWRSDSQKQSLDICRYNVAIISIKSKSDIYKCGKIWNKTFKNMCNDIIKNRYKF